MTERSSYDTASGETVFSSRLAGLQLACVPGRELMTVIRPTDDDRLATDDLFIILKQLNFTVASDRWIDRIRRHIAHEAPVIKMELNPVIDSR